MKIRTYVAIMILMLSLTITNTFAANGDDKVPVKERVAAMTNEQKAARLEEIKERVGEIKEMNKSELSKTERKDLKKELRDMRKEARVISGGVYLSVGAIIVIILVLILIL